MPITFTSRYFHGFHLCLQHFYFVYFFFLKLPGDLKFIFGSWKKRSRRTLDEKKSRYLRFKPNLAHREVNRFSQSFAQFLSPGSFELHAAIFSNLVKMKVPPGRNLLRVLRRMKACIDEFQPNTSQANYFERFWRITSKINAKIEVRKP